jgi:hypothetical protein
LTLEAIANNSDGYVVTEGPLTGVNTSGLTEGGLVFVSETTGQLTSTRPTQPAHGVVVGWCVKAGAGTSGILYVKVDNGLELDELHDVLISSATTGQVLRRASSGLWTNQTLVAADVGADASGTAAAAITAHLATVDHTSVTLGATVADVLGLTGQQLTADDPGAGADRLVFWDHSAGRLRHLTLGSGLTITDTTIDAAGGTGGYPAFSAPTGFSVTGSGTAFIALSFATGYSLPTTASQASWDTAAGLAATAVQPAALSAYVQTSDSRLTDAREWSAATVTQAAAEAGTETERRAWTVQRVWQAAGAWWLSITGATGRSLAGASTPTAGRAVLELGTAATTDATAYASASHTQAASTITGLASVATSGAYSDLSGRPTIPAAADAAPLALAAAASIGTSADYAREDHVHPLPAVVTTTAAGLAPATSFAALTYAATTDLDMATLDGQFRTITLTGDLTLTTSNRAAGRVVLIRLLPGASQRTLTFPVGWVFVGNTKPATLAASKTAVLSLTFFGTADTDCVAAYAVQS